MEYKQSIEAFKDSCRMYRNEKELLKNDSEKSEMFIQFLEDDITFTEHIFDRILAECGRTAKQVVYELFVEERTQLEVAYSMGISRRKLQYLMEQWLHTIFGETA